MSDSHEHMVTIRRSRLLFARLVRSPTIFVATMVLLITVGYLSHPSFAETASSTVAVGVWPRYLAVNPSTNKIYVVNNSVGTVTVINGETHVPITTVTVGSNPSAIAVNAVTNMIYVANVENQGFGSVTIIDGATDIVSATVTVGFSPKALVVNPDTNKIFVANSFSNSVTIIDAADSNSTSNVAVGTFPVALAVNPGTNMVYVANSATNGTVTVINAADNNSTATVAVGSYPGAVAVNMASGKVYVTNLYSDSVTVIDPANSNGTTDVAVGSFPFAVAINQATNKIFVVNQGDGVGNSTVSTIDGTTDTVGAPAVTVGVLAYDIAANQATNKVYVANRGNDTVTMIDVATNTPTTLSAPVGQVWDAPRAVAVNRATNKIYVANEISGNVTVIQNYYSVAVTSAGKGTVTSVPAGINCGTTCSALYPEGTPVVMFQTPAIDSGFSGWGGGACAGTADCAFSVLSDTSVTADFIASPLVKNQRTGVAYTSLQLAYNEANGGDTISSLTVLPAEGLTLDTDISITLDGGYDASYSSCTGMTPVLGRVNVRLAPLHVRGLAIR